MNVPFLGGDDLGYGLEEGICICPEEAEYVLAIHCNATNYISLQGGSAVVRGMGLKKVVVTGKVGLGGGMCGGSASAGGGTRIGGRKCWRRVLGN